MKRKSDKYPIIGFGYQSRVGKDSCCRAVVRSSIARDNHFGGCDHLSFAAHLKAVCYQIYRIYGLRGGTFYECGEPGEALRDTPLPNINKSPVEIWIEVGKKMREISPNIWVDHVVDRFRSSHIALVSDVRFQNEFDAIKKRNGWCVLVKRKGNPVKGSDMMLSEDSDWNWIIENDGTLQDLAEKARHAAKEYLSWFFGAR